MIMVVTPAGILMEDRVRSVVGQKYGRLTVVGRAPHRNGKAAWYAD